RGRATPAATAPAPAPDLRRPPVDLRGHPAATALGGRTVGRHRRRGTRRHARRRGRAGRQAVPVAVTMAGMAPAVHALPPRWPRLWSVWQLVALLLLLLAVGLASTVGHLGGVRLLLCVALSVALIAWHWLMLDRRFGPGRGSGLGYATGAIALCVTLI